ncbi:MAG: hypothetical protein LBR91_01525 [Puniceicoccales bacterium]|jgi:hypothetical protein|nr:hypothetical protein [Puniceicoccales bacterium]
MMCVAYTIWVAATMALEGDVGLVFGEEQQLQRNVGGKLNLATVLKYTLCHGTYARSTFIQTSKQFEALVDFAEYLVSNQEQILPDPQPAAN